MRDYNDIASRREAARSLPKAWRKLVDEPEDLLVELLGEQTEALSGYRPTSAEITAFLRSLTTGKEIEEKNSIQPGIHKRSEVLQHDPSLSLQTANSIRAVSYILFGTKHNAPNASIALIEILAALAKRHPEKMEAVSTAVTGKSRNHIAKTVSEIYPARPDLARAVEFSPGWLIGLNIANREKMRIIRETCRIVGARFGTEVVIDLPNADA